MNKPTPEILAAAIALRENGATIKEVLATPFREDGKVDQKKGQTLSYSQFWYAEQRAKVAGTDLDISADPSPANIARQREAGFSWGQIAVNANWPESRVRKTFEATTGTKSVGLRIGKGGRFLTDDGIFYNADRKTTGTAIPAEAKITEVKAVLYADIEDARAERKAAKKAGSKKAKAAKK